MRTRGFTVIEIIITVTIMGILLTLGAVGWSTTQIKARDNERIGDIEAIQAGLEALYLSGVSTVSSAPQTTNLITNPGLHAGTTNWSVSTSAGSSGTPTNPTSGGPFSVVDTFFRRTTLTSPTSNPLRIAPTSTGTSSTPVTASTTYTASGYIRSSASVNNVRMDAMEYDAGGTSLGLVAGPNYAQSPNNWQRISHTFTTSPTTAFIRILFTFSDPAGAAIGTTFDATGAMVTQGDTLYDYADGTSTSWTWSGTANNSASTGTSVAKGRPGTYPGIVLTNSILTDFYLSNADQKSFLPPGQTDPAASFLPATNAVQTTNGVLPQPTIGQYIYQPIDSYGNLCNDFSCRKYNLYYRLEADNTVYKVTSKSQ